MRSNIISKAFAVLFTFVLLAAVCIAPQTAFAADISAEAQAVIDLIAKLPTDTKTVTADNKDDIVAAKVAYDALTPDQKIEIASDQLVILNSDYSAVMPYVLANLVTECKAMDVDKLGNSDKDKIVGLYTDYGILDDTAKEAFSKEHKEKLLTAVQKLSPDSLTEDDKELASQLAEEEPEEEEQEDDKVSLSTIWQIAIIIFVSLIVLCGLAAMIVLLIKIIKLSR